MLPCSRNFEIGTLSLHISAPPTIDTLRGSLPCLHNSCQQNALSMINNSVNMLKLWLFFVHWCKCVKGYNDKKQPSYSVNYNAFRTRNRGGGWTELHTNVFFFNPIIFQFVFWGRNIPTYIFQSSMGIFASYSSWWNVYLDCSISRQSPRIRATTTVIPCNQLFNNYKKIKLYILAICGVDIIIISWHMSM